MNHRAAVTPYLEPRGVQEHGGGTSQVQQLKTSDAGNAMVGITDVYQSEPWQDLNELWHPCHISMGAH